VNGKINRDGPLDPILGKQRFSGLRSGFRSGRPARFCAFRQNVRPDLWL